MQNEYVEFLFRLSAIIVAITTVSKFSINIWKKGVAEPHNKAMENVAESMLEPIIEKLDQTLDFMADSKRDRLLLHERTKCQDDKLEEHSEKLYNHDTRITVLEDNKKYCDSKRRDS